MSRSHLLRRGLHLLFVLGLGAAGTACSTQGFLFRQDRRVKIAAPEQDQKVSLPLTVRWTLAEGVEVGEEIASFAVFFDTEPQPPNEPLAYLARGDETCKRTPGCPDAAYFAGRGIYATAGTQLDLDDLLPAPGVDLDRGDRDRHEVTIIALDAAGRRLSEASWSRSFEIVRSGPA